MAYSTKQARKSPVELGTAGLTGRDLDRGYVAVLHFAVNEDAGDGVRAVDVQVTEADLEELGARIDSWLQQNAFPERKHLNFMGKILCLGKPVEQARGLRHEHMSEADPESRPQDYCPRCVGCWEAERWPGGKPPEPARPENTP